MKIIAELGEEIVIKRNDTTFVVWLVEGERPWKTKLKVRSDIWRPPGEWRPLDAEERSDGSVCVEVTDKR